MREFILLLAYKACEKSSGLFGKHPFQYRSAANLITLLFLIHIAQVVFLFSGLPSTDNTTYGALLFLSLFVLFFLIGFSVDSIFSKAVLAKSINRYKDYSIFKFSKFIMFSYLIVNLLILSLILVNKLVAFQ